MEPSELNLSLVAVVALLVLVGAAWAFRVSGKVGKQPRVLLRVVVSLIGFAALLLVGRTLWWELAGSATQPNCWRSPSFYLSAAVIVGAMSWLWSQLRGSVGTRTLRVGGLLLLVVVVVGGMETSIDHVHQAQSKALGLAVRGAAGQAAPEIEFVDLDEHRHALSEYKGKVVLLNFWSTTCGPCIREMPGLSELKDRYAARGFELILLSADDEAPQLAAFFASHPTAVKGRLISEALTPSFYHAYEAWPLSFLVDRSGLVFGAWIGDSPTDHMAELIERAL